MTSLAENMQFLYFALSTSLIFLGAKPKYRPSFLRTLNGYEAIAIRPSPSSWSTMAIGPLARLILQGAAVFTSVFGG